MDKLKDCVPSQTLFSVSLTRFLVTTFSYRQVWMWKREMVSVVMIIPYLTNASGNFRRFLPDQGLSLEFSLNINIFYY